MYLAIAFLFCLTGLCAKPLEINTRAKAALVMNADTGAVLYEKNGHVTAYPASTTKIATALFALDEKRLDLNKMVQVSAEAVRVNPGKRTDDTPSYWHESDATRMGLVRGEILSLEALMHGLLLVSGNDAANVIGEVASGSVPQYIDELNDYVRRLGCTNTHFTNPHGYHHSNHVSTPYDLCLLMKKALDVPSLKEIMGKLTYKVPKTNKRPEGEIKQFNSLVNPAKKYFYPKATIGKTGYYSLAGWCLVAVASHEGRTLIACVLGCPKSSDRFEETRRLFDLAFAEKKVERSLVQGSQKFVKKVIGGKNSLSASLTRNLVLSFYPSEESEVKAFIHWNPPAFPIQKGAVVGEVRVLDEKDRIVAKEDLYATETVNCTFLYSLKEKLSRFFR